MKDTHDVNVKLHLYHQYLHIRGPSEGGKLKAVTYTATSLPEDAVLYKQCIQLVFSMKMTN